MSLIQTDRQVFFESYRDDQGLHLYKYNTSTSTSTSLYKYLKFHSLQAQAIQALCACILQAQGPLTGCTPPVQALYLNKYVHKPCSHKIQAQFKVAQIWFLWQVKLYRV